VNQTETPTTVAVPTVPGFEPGEPPWLPWHLIRVDKRVCAALVCPRCGGRQMNRHPFFTLIPMRYRMYAVCPCGHCEEM
jgi:hypothetical protein